MGTSVSITFPLGRYHATPWDGGANTSEVEWPPSPWRILRALVATWYTRWPDLPAIDLDRILTTLDTPDAYLTPPATTGSTRHYMPDLRHSRAETGNTDQVIDAFLAVPRDEPLRIHWIADLSVDDRATLAKLLELMPYLGRSESLCAAKLDDDDPVPDATWWRRGDTSPGTRQVRLLAPVPGTAREQLETTTVATRKARRLLPEGSQKVSYGCRPTEPVVQNWTQHRRPHLTCLRFELSSPVSVRARNAILVADAMHKAISKVLKEEGFEAERTAAFLGKTSEGSPRGGLHDHVHIVALPDRTKMGPLLAANTHLTSLYILSAVAIPDDFAGTIQQRIRQLWVPTHLDGEMATQNLLVSSSGLVDGLLPELAAESREWISVTPYLPVRHQHRRQTTAEYLLDDLAYECGYRQIIRPVGVEPIDHPAGLRELAQFRRRRMSEPMQQRRQGAYVLIRFDQPVRGPLLLGQLSHFGYGVFMPPT
jgi:CRISPR-associated protein Csb2